MKLGLIIFNLLLTTTLALLMLAFYFHAKNKLRGAGNNLRELGNQYIIYEVDILDTIPLSTKINIENKTLVGILMDLNDSVKIDMVAKYHDGINVPVNFNLDEIVNIDTMLTLPDSLSLLANCKIPVNQKFSLPNLEGIKVAVQATIPLNQLISARAPGPIRFKSHIPIRMKIVQNLPINLDLRIPINERVKLNLPIANYASIYFPEPLLISGRIPIHLRVPIKIPLSKTPIKQYLDSTANDLDGLLNF